MRSPSLPADQRTSGLNSLKGVIWGIIWESITGVSKGETRSFDYGSGHGLLWRLENDESLQHKPSQEDSVLRSLVGRDRTLSEGLSVVVCDGVGL